MTKAYPTYTTPVYFLYKNRYFKAMEVVVAVTPTIVQAIASINRNFLLIAFTFCEFLLRGVLVVNVSYSILTKGDSLVPSHHGSGLDCSCGLRSVVASPMTPCLDLLVH